MSFNGFIDNYAMSIGALVARKHKYFSKGVESKKIIEVVDALNIDMPNIKGTGYYPFFVEYEEKKQEAAVNVEQWITNESPVIIYHHGAAEGSYDFSFKRILGKNKNEIKANLIAVQAPFNQNNKTFLESISYLSNYTFMLAGSVVIIDKLIDQLRKLGSEKIIVTGVSLGGFVTNLHFTYRNSADEYRPLFAGGKLADAFINSAYSKVTSLNGKNNPKKLEEALNFDKDLIKRDQSKLYPLLGEQDQIVKYDTQRNSYNSVNLKTVPYGHATGSTKFKLLREFILEAL
jgi:hypothetical protein